MAKWHIIALGGAAPDHLPNQARRPLRHGWGMSHDARAAALLLALVLPRGARAVLLDEEASTARMQDMQTRASAAMSATRTVERAEEVRAPAS